jgi:hypothetical protein
MKKTFLPFCISFLIFATSNTILCSCTSNCSKKVTCPGYNDTLLNTWFPYTNNEVLIFKSTTNLYDTFHLSLRDSTAPYEYNSTNSNNGSCNADKEFASNETDSNNFPALDIRMITLSTSNSETSDADLFFYHNEFEGQNLTENGFLYFNSLGMYTYLSQILFNYSLNGTTYAIAQSVTTNISDTTLAKNFMGVYKVTFAKNAGIISFVTIPDSVVWIKQ